MSSASLEERVAELERVVAQLVNGSNSKKDWRSAVGMFANDPVMKEIDEEGRKIREAERKAAQQEEAGSDQ